MRSIGFFCLKTSSRFEGETISGTKKPGRASYIPVASLLFGQSPTNILQPPTIHSNLTATTSLKRTVLLHDAQNLDDDLGSRSDEHLTLASSFGVDNVVETVVEDGDSDHFERW